MLRGQEIYTFFNIYGIKGFFGLVLSIVLIKIIIYKTFKIILKNKINTYENFLTTIMPEKLKENRLFNLTVNNIINIFLLISFNIMVAGFATYFFQELNISKWFGAIIISVISLITFSKSIDGVIKINSYLIPILIALIILLGIKKISGILFYKEENKIALNWILSAILYASYNSITLIPILVGLKDRITNKKDIKLIASFTAIIMLILSITIFLLMHVFAKEIKDIEIPIVYIASTIGKGFKYIYGIVILIAIFTTAISAGYGFLSNSCKNRKKYMLVASIMCTCSVILGQISFSGLINLLYPIFGYLGIIQIIFLLIS